jgi:hypothetical protein
MGKRMMSIRGGNFYNFVRSASLREENAEVFPRNFIWNGGGVDSPIFFIDGGHQIRWNSTEYDRMKTCLMLVEPPHLRPENYEAAIESQNLYNYIFTYDRKTLAQLDPAKRRFYVLGGSSIAFDKWGITEKTKNVCMFYSGKNTTEGHKLRKQVIDHLGAKIDVFGAGVGAPVPSKYDILKHYRYCIVIESGQADYYFTEKLIDPLSVGTIPIYWGCPSAGQWFQDTGITPLEWVLDDFDYWTTNERYDNLQTVIGFNMKRARKYAICEDWMYNTYPEVFNV